MKVRLSLGMMVIAGVFAACGGGDPELAREIDPAAAEEYEVPQSVAQDMELPEPGVDASNTIAMRHYPDENVFELAVGPVSLEAGAPHVLLPNAITAFPFDFHLTGYSWSVTDADHNELPQELLHHFNIINPNRRELFYPIAQRLFAAGRETPGAAFPAFTGTPVEGENPLIVVSMFANPTDTDYDEAYFRLWIEYKEDWDPLVEVFPFYLDAAGPIPPQDFEVPPGETTVSDTASPAIEGRIVGIGGHVHDYGTSLVLANESEDNVIWDVEPVIEEGRVVSMPTDFFLLPWKGDLDPNDEYLVQTTYDNPLDKPAPGMGMGSIGGVFTTDASDDWNAVDTSHQAYVDDMVMTLSAPMYHDWRSLTPDEMRRRIASDHVEMASDGGGHGAHER